MLCYKIDWTAASMGRRHPGTSRKSSLALARCKGRTYLGLIVKETRMNRNKGERFHPYPYPSMQMGKRSA